MVEKPLANCVKWRGCPIIKFGALPLPIPTMVTLVLTQI
jgi:hypothetical protein